MKGELNKLKKSQLEGEEKGKGRKKSYPSRLMVMVALLGGMGNHQPGIFFSIAGACRGGILG